MSAAGSQEYITIARVAKTQGRHGEVAAELHTDFPEKFAERKKLFALDASGGRRELRLEEYWSHKSYVVLKFAGIESISDAEALVGCEIQVPREQRVELDAGAYVSYLIGCAVFDQSGAIGSVKDVQFGAGEAPLLVVSEGAREVLIPFAQEFIVGIDIQGKRVEMKLPSGMLEIDAPLSDEEKRASGNKQGRRRREAGSRRQEAGGRKQAPDRD
jgi:16S rRNA processing protein RimM